VTLLDLVQYSLLILLAWELAGRFGLVGAGITWLVAVASSQVLGMYFLRQLLPDVWAGLAKPLLGVVSSSVIGAVAAWGLIQLDAGRAGLAASVSVSVLVTGAVLWALDRRLRLEMVSNLRRAFPNAMMIWRVPAGFPRAWLPAPRRGGAR
jgi:hypothetical protein